MVVSLFCTIVSGTSMLWNFYALELLCFASSLLPAPSHCEFVTFVSKVRVPIKYLPAEASIMYATITQKSHAVLTSLIPRSRPAFCRLQYGLHWKRRKAGRGLGTRLVLTIFTCTLQRGTHLVACTPERQGQVSRSCWYTLHSSVSLEPTLDCSCRLWWPLLLHFGSYQ